jgi:hypothetical protein
LKLFKSIAELLNLCIDDIFKLQDPLLGEEWIQGSAASAVMIVVDGGETRIIDAELPNIIRIFVAGRGEASVEHVDEIGIIDVKLVRADPNNWALKRGLPC